MTKSRKILSKLSADKTVELFKEKLALLELQDLEFSAYRPRFSQNCVS